MRNHILTPRISLCETDHRQLLLLARADSGRWAEAADDLLRELDRARVVAEPKLPTDVVRMGSSVTFHADTGEVREVTLVYPAQADISARRISVLTPVGTALIGLRTGQSITWQARDAQRRVLTVLSVTQPAMAE